MNKKIKIILLALLGVMILYTTLWSAYVTVRYSPFIKAQGGQKLLEKDGYVYYVKKPTFPSFTGNLSIAESRRIKPHDDGIYAYLIIWPRAFGGYDVAANIGTTTVDIENRSSHTFAYGIMLDEDRKPDYSVSDVYKIYAENKELFDNNMYRIDDLYEKSHEMWGILENSDQ